MAVTYYNTYSTDDVSANLEDMAYSAGTFYRSLAT